MTDPRGIHTWDVGPDGRPVAFGDLPREAFPVRITAFDPDGAVVWERTIEPYVAVDIPAPPEHLRGKISLLIERADGITLLEEPVKGEGDGDGV